ncbi:MAK10-like protein [Tanacetum coccineum]
MNTIELPVRNNVVPLRSDTIRLVQNGCSFHGLRERTRLRLFQFSLRDQASNWLERLPAGSITTWEDLTTRFLAQFFPPGRTIKLRNDILMFQQHHGESLSEVWTRFKDLLQKVPHHGTDLWLQVQIFYDHVNPITRRTIEQSAGVNAIALPQDVPSTSDRRHIKLENQVQCLMEAHFASTQPTQVNKITTSCEICSGPHDTQYCMEDPEQASVKYASSHTHKTGSRPFTINQGPRSFNEAINAWKEKLNFNWAHAQTFINLRNGSLSTYSSNYQTKLEKELKAPVTVVVRDFYKKFYNFLGKKCSIVDCFDTATSKGCLDDKILVPRTPDSSQQPLPKCARCETPIDDFEDTSESSDDNTNVVNAPQEPCIINQDPGKNPSPSPPQIDHCCHECGDSLDGIFCQRCTCKSYGKGAHYGYNCPPKVPIISNPELPNNQAVDEPPQSVQQQCLFRTCQQCGCNEYDGVCFYCKIGNGTPINVSSLYSSNNSPSVPNPTPQPPTHSYDICGNNSYYGYDCAPQVPFIHNPEPCYNQDFNFPQTLPSFQQQRLGCEKCGGPHETFQCQPMNEDYYHEQNPCYDSNSFGFDQVQPLQYTVNHPIFNSQNELLNSSNKLMEQITNLCELVGQAIQKKEEEKQIAEEKAGKDRYWKIPIC